METTPSTIPTTTAESTEFDGIETEENATDLRKGQCTYRLEQLAYLRSGDKGNTANIGTRLHAEN